MGYWICGTFPCPGNPKGGTPEFIDIGGNVVVNVWELGWKEPPKIGFCE